MHERRDGGHEEVDAVADEQNRRHNEQPCHDTGVIGDETAGQGVEDRGKHTARKTDGEESDVRQHVGEDTRNIIISIPQTDTQIEEGILARRVEEEHQYGAQTDRRIEGRRGGRIEGNHPRGVEHRQASGQAAGQDHQQPTQRSERIAESGRQGDRHTTDGNRSRKRTL